MGGQLQALLLYGFSPPVRLVHNPIHTNVGCFDRLQLGTMNIFLRFEETGLGQGTLRPAVMSE